MLILNTERAPGTVLSTVSARSALILSPCSLPSHFVDEEAKAERGYTHGKWWSWEGHHSGRPEICQ